MATRQPTQSPGLSAQIFSLSQPTSPEAPPVASGDGQAAVSGNAPPTLGTSCDEDDGPPKLVPLTTGDDDNKPVAPSKRLQVHWTHGRKRRASGDSHEVL